MSWVINISFRPPVWFSLGEHRAPWYIKLHFLFQHTIVSQCDEECLHPQISTSWAWFGFTECLIYLLSINHQIPDKMLGLLLVVVYLMRLSWSQSTINVDKHTLWLTSVMNLTWGTPNQSSACCMASLAFCTGWFGSQSAQSGHKPGGMQEGN